MKRIIVCLFASLILLAGCGLRVKAQTRGGAVVSVQLIDASNDEPVGFATVSLTPKGAAKPSKYGLTDDQGKGKLEGVRPGNYTFKAEIMGYKPFEKVVDVKENIDLGKVKLSLDQKVLDAASVSAVGNPIVVKKDTIEYNASSFKTTENDVLEDLLKKLPGVEINEDGSITANGKTISKITIDGKTFFLNDPQLASKNLPAKMIERVKVIEKKSDQAEFTGIDDGEEEQIIDLSVKKGMMNGLIGNMSLGGGHDVPSTDVQGDYRFQGAGFMGKFTEKSNLSLIVNANNTNNRGFNDLSGGMMGAMRGGGMGRGSGGFGGGNGITTSYMGGLNGSWNLFDDKMELGSNYLYNGSNRYVEETESTITHRQDDDLINYNTGSNITNSYGHRIGARMTHKFSENTSIVFEPSINFGTGDFSETSVFNTKTDLLNGTVENTNDGNKINSGNNKNLNASGFLLLRQRLGLPGRTMTVMTRFSASQNLIDGINKSVTNSDFRDGAWQKSDVVDQTYNQKSNSSSVMGRVTYTEPLGNHFYVEANYSYNWRKSVSEKKTYNELLGGAYDITYSNSIVNESQSHNIGANMLYQSSSMRAQVGFAAIPTHTYNSTMRAGSEQKYDDMQWRFSPQGSMFWDINDNANVRIFYRGSSEQPSTSQLMSVPDNSNPLNISFGNPSLAPYFSHSIRSDIRYTNKQTFSSFNMNIDGGYTQDPIVSAIWYGANGAQYSMPFNGPGKGNVGMNMFANVPIAKSNFSVSNMTRLNFSQSTSYVGGKELALDKYYDNGELDYTSFLADYNSGKFAFDENVTKTFGATERLRFTYRSDDLELTTSARTRMNKSWYTIASNNDNTTTWNNQLGASINWTIPVADLTLKSDFNYNFYRGYTTEQPSEYILNAEIQKLLFKKTVTLALKGYDILGQARNLSVSDVNNYHRETLNNTLGRYIIVSLTYRFGSFGGRRGGGMRGGPGMGGPMGPPMGGGRPF
ncbi:MAG: outer membrane beta-barrel protein [Bacteroidales bacterium]|nr:outer membrane beta-barrel protein [Bacteroidales bacterium]